MIGREGFFGQIFHLWAGKARSPLAPLTRAYIPYLPLVSILGLLASLLESVGIGLLIPLVALLLAGSSAAGLPAPVAELAAWTNGLDRQAAIIGLGAAVMGFILIKGLVQALNGVLIANMDGRLGRDIRDALFARIVQLDYPFFLRNEAARLVQIISTDCWYASEAVRAVLTMIPAAIALAVFALILLWLDWKLTLMVLGGAVLIQWMLIFMQRQQRRLGFEVVASNQRLGERMLAIVGAIRSIRVFGQERRELTRFSTASEEVRRGVFRTRRLTVTVVPIVEVLFSALLVAVLVVAYRLNVALPTITAYLVLLARAQPYANTISRSRVEYASLRGSLREVEWLLGQPTAPQSLAGTKQIAEVGEPIRFQSVSYSYPDGTPALHDVSVVLRPGVATALIGTSGAGKSSFVDLLCRLVEPQSGVILHGDVPINEIDPQCWRSRIAIAGQNVDLVDGTIAENIAYGRPESSRKEIEAAAVAASAADFIRKLPGGYDTRLGLDGLKLSGGERQRIGLARALLGNPDLLILDEATNAVDAMAERTIMNALYKHRRFRTAVVISHRKSTVTACEDGIVLEHGRLLEAGRLDELRYFERMATAEDE